MGNGNISFTVCTLVLAFPSVALAQDGPAASGPGMGARATGAGLTGMADPNDAAMIQRNLATVSLLPHYDVVAGMGFGPDKLFLTRAAAVDSRTSPVTMGLSWYRFTDESTLTGEDLPGWQIPGSSLLNPSEHWGVAAGLAYPFLDRRLSLGITGRYDWQTGVETGTETAWNFGFTAAAAPFEGLTLAVGMRDLLRNYRDTTRAIDFGARWSVGGAENAVAAVEVNSELPWEDQLEWSQARLGAGVSLDIVQVIFLRTGWMVTGGNHDLTLGLGLGSEHAAIDYGVRLGVGDNKETMPVWHGLDLRVIF